MDPNVHKNSREQAQPLSSSGGSGGPQPRLAPGSGPICAPTAQFRLEKRTGSSGAWGSAPPELPQAPTPIPLASHEEKHPGIECCLLTVVHDGPVPRRGMRPRHQEIRHRHLAACDEGGDRRTEAERDGAAAEELDQTGASWPVLPWTPECRLRVCSSSGGITTCRQMEPGP